MQASTGKIHSILLGLVLALTVTGCNVAMTPTATGGTGPDLTACATPTTFSNGAVIQPKPNAPYVLTLDARHRVRSLTPRNSRVFLLPRLPVPRYTASHQAGVRAADRSAP